MTSRFHSSVAVLAITESRISCTWILGAFAARKNNWSLLTDIIYLDIAVDKTADLSIPIGGARYLDLDQTMFLTLESLGPGQSQTISESLTSFDGIVGLMGNAALGGLWTSRSSSGTSNGILIRPGWLTKSTLADRPWV